MNSKSQFQCLSLLDDLGYLPAAESAVLPNLNQILYRSIKTVLEEKLSVPVSNALISQMCSTYGLSEQELLTNYDLFENSLYKTLKAEGAAVITNWIKRDLLVHAILNHSTLTEKEILNPSLRVHDILRDIGAVKVLEFIRNMRPPQHVLFLYEDENFKDKALSAFFNGLYVSSTTNSKIRRRARKPSGYAVHGLISAKEPAINKCNFFLDSSVSFDELFSQLEKVEVVKKLHSWIQSVRFLNDEKQGGSALIRIASDDSTWFLNNGLRDEIILAEKGDPKYTEDPRLMMLCTYNILNMRDAQTIKEIMTAHNHVILDSPLIVYRARAERSAC